MVKGKNTMRDRFGVVKVSGLTLATDGRRAFSGIVGVRFAETYCRNIHSTNFYINPGSISGSDTGSAFTKNH